MRILIDTQLLLWAIYQPDRLSYAVRERLCNRANEVYYSAVSIAEIAIKASLGRADFPFQPEEVIDAASVSAFTELPLDVRQAARLSALAWHHRDPFDRLLVAQAIETGLRFMTADAMLLAYSDLVEIIR